MNIYEKLQIIQSKLKAPKNQRNNFGNYNYRNCEDILEAVKPLLDEVKAVLVLNDTIEMVGERYYVKAVARLYDTETTEISYIENSAYAREEETKKGMDGSQITGASSSYARKYALNGLFAIDDTRDSDTTNVGDKPITRAKPTAKTLYKCSVCGKDITESLYTQSVDKYGTALCSKECKEMYMQFQQGEE